MLLYVYSGPLFIRASLNCSDMLTLPDPDTHVLYRLVVRLLSLCVALEDAGRGRALEVGVEVVGRVNPIGIATFEFDGECVERCRVIGKLPAIFLFFMIAVAFELENSMTFD